MNTIRPYPLVCFHFGFTLVETLISLGILSAVAAIGFGSGMDGYERELARSDRSSVLWSTLEARAETLHGVCEGSSCTAGVSHTATIDSSHGITFLSLSGLVTDPESIVIGNGTSASTLSVNDEGQVSLFP